VAAFAAFLLDAYYTSAQNRYHC